MLEKHNMTHRSCDWYCWTFHISRFSFAGVWGL